MESFREAKSLEVLEAASNRRGEGRPGAALRSALPDRASLELAGGFMDTDLAVLKELTGLTRPKLAAGQR